jgi:16S rRNA processing protein RimM
VVLGRVRAPYGVRGWLSVQPLTETVDGMLGYERWWLGPGAGWQPRRLLEGRVHRGGLVARLEGIEDRDAAAGVRGWRIAVPRSQLPPPPPGEYYWSDLLGLRVENLQGEYLGRVAEIFATGANDVLVVRAERERLIPFIEPVLVRAELEQDRLVVDWHTDY